jgi:hypothetical protein
LVFCLDESGARHGGRLLCRLEHVVEREVIAHELVGMDLDLDRAHIAAEHGNLGDARNRQQSQPQRPVGERAQIHERTLLGGKAKHQHRRGGGGQRRHRRGGDVRRELPRGFGEPLSHHLPVAIDVGVGAEDDGDDRQALNGRRAQRLHRRHAVDGVLDRLRHQDLDLLGGEPRGLGLDADLWGSELGEHVVLGAHDGERAVPEQHEGERHDDAAKANGKADDRGLQAALRSCRGHRQRH